MGITRSELFWMAGLGVVLGLLISLFILAAPRPAHAIDCLAAPPKREPWSLRTIDGRSCFYAGRRRLAKSELHWTKKIAADLDPPPPPEPKITIVKTRPSLSRFYYDRESFQSRWDALNEKLSR